MQRRATIIQVAQRAGVSFKTVSNVINHTGNMRPATRARVVKAMDELGYKVNLSARSLRKGGTRLIGVAIFDFSQPFSPLLLDQIIRIADERGYGVIISTYGFKANGIEDIIDQMDRVAVDGWVFFSDRPLHDRGVILEQQYPMVLTGDYLSYGKTDSVTMPNVEAVHEVTSRLISLGCKRIGLIGAPSGMTAGDITGQGLCRYAEGTRELRVRGYVTAMQEAGLPVDLSIVVAAESWTNMGGMRATVRMLDQAPAPDAIVCLNDAMAIGAMSELRRRRLSIPEDIQVVGFDNISEGEYAFPSLTTIDPDIEDYARAAVDMLIERIHGYDGAPRSYVTDFSILDRASTRALSGAGPSPEAGLRPDRHEATSPRGVGTHFGPDQAEDKRVRRGIPKGTTIMADYHVQYEKDRDVWSVKRAGASRATRTYPTQAEATKAAKAYADKSGGGEVNVHDKEGNRIRDKRTIGKKDPRSTKG